MLNWSQQFSICSLFDSHQYSNNYSSFDCIMAVGSLDSIVLNTTDYAALQKFTQQNNRWLFGHISFEFHDLIKVDSSKKDRIGFPLLHLYEPAIIIQINDTEVSITAGILSPEKIFEEINNISSSMQETSSAALQPAISKAEYLRIIKSLQNHILRGDCYEINFCQEFYGEAIDLSPYELYKKLSTVSPTPFSSFYRMEDKFLTCSSPERFLKKKGHKIIAQPIKGTIPRNLLNEQKDETLKTSLYHSEKDRSENVMIVDLMRNDLSRIALEGTVKVEELFGIYSFPQVHQMISTVTGVISAETSFADIIRETFPMGSMTGAPKKRVLELIDQFEPVRRGLYSGSVGYITPGGDFDFNVVIRSILYNATDKTASYQVGSGITFYSNAEDEYEECLLKAIGMQKALA